MPLEFAQASKGQVSYGLESPKYTKATSSNKYFGIVEEDVQFPDLNPRRMHATGGAGRKPVTTSPQPRALQFTIPFTVIDANAPLEVALGKRTTTSVDPDANPGSGDEYQRDLFTEESSLPTMTVERAHDDLQLREFYVGTKAGLNISAQQGEVVKFRMPCVAAKHEYTENEAAPALNIPDNKEPLAFIHKGDVTLYDDGTQNVAKTVATVSGFELGWDPGLRGLDHGKGRDMYAVAEENAANLYQHKLTVNVIDRDLWKRSRDDAARVDIEIPLDRGLGWGVNFRDGAIIRLKKCKLGGNLNLPAQGEVDMEIPVYPLSTEIEIRSPT